MLMLLIVWFLLSILSVIIIAREDKEVTIFGIFLCLLNPIAMPTVLIINQFEGRDVTLWEKKQRSNMKKHYIEKLNQYKETSGVSSWYKDARLYAYGLSKKYGVSLISVVGIIAALSPRNRWERNKLDADNLLCEFFTGNKVTYGTFNSNVYKARRILFECQYLNGNTNRVKEILKGRKTVSFFDNIYNPESTVVTVDEWVSQFHDNKRVSIKNRKAVTKKRYDEIEKTIKELATISGLKPYEVQATLWVGFRNESTQ
jgi:hypothetical protein